MGGATNTGKTWTWGPEAAEESLNMLIERRAWEAADANHAARAWAESGRNYDLAQASERRRAWVQYHREQAARCRAALTALIAHHEAAAASLAREAGGDPDGY